MFLHVFVNARLTYSAGLAGGEARPRLGKLVLISSNSLSN
jgi:hypothetical protein